MTISTLLILTVCRTRVIHEPCMWPSSPRVHRSSVVRTSDRFTENHKFKSCRGIASLDLKVAINKMRDVFLYQNKVWWTKQQLHRCITFLCHFCTTATSKCQILWRTKTSNEERLFLLLNLDMVSWNSTSGDFAYIRQSKWENGQE